MTYKVIRFYFNNPGYRRTIRTGLTRAEAQAHCSDPDTSSTTCETPVGKARTRRLGPWFDGYEEDKR